MATRSFVPAPIAGHHVGPLLADAGRLLAVRHVDRADRRAESGRSSGCWPARTAAAPIAPPVLASRPAPGQSAELAIDAPETRFAPAKFRRRDRSRAVAAAFAERNARVADQHAGSSDRVHAAGIFTMEQERPRGPMITLSAVLSRKAISWRRYCSRFVQRSGRIRLAAAQPRNLNDAAQRRLLVAAASDARELRLDDDAPILPDVQVDQGPRGPGGRL